MIAAAIDQGGQVNYDGIETPERAEEIRRGIYRCAQHRKLSVQVRWLHNGELTSKTTSWPPDKAKTGYRLEIEVFRKAHGRRHVVETRGPDRTLWDYNPRQKGT